jgi:hypothetical protein
MACRFFVNLSPTNKTALSGGTLILPSVFVLDISPMNAGLEWHGPIDVAL